VASLVPPLIRRRVVDEVLGPEATTDVSGEGFTRLGVLVLGLLLVECTTWAVQWGQGLAATWLGARITADVRAALYRCLEMLSLKVYDTRTTGALMARVTADAGTLEHFLIRGLPQLIIHALTFVGVLAVMVWMNWQLALVILVPVPAIWAWSVVFWRRMSPLLRRSSQVGATFSGELAEALAGIRVVKAFGQEREAVGKFAHSNDRLRRLNVKTHRTRAVLMATTNLVTGLGILILWLVGGREVIRGELTLGTLLALYGYVSLFY